MPESGGADHVAVRADGVSEPATTLTAVSVRAATTLNGADGDRAGSEVVETVTVLSAARRAVGDAGEARSSRARPAAIARPREERALDASPPGFEQLPTAAPPALTVAPAYPRTSVPAGKVTSMRLLASSDERACRGGREADDVSVRAPAAAEGEPLTTVTAVRRPRARP